MAFADNLPRKLREKIPTLENFAVVSSAELWEMGQSMLALTEQIAVLNTVLVAVARASEKILTGGESRDGGSKA